MKAGGPELKGGRFIRNAKVEATPIGDDEAIVFDPETPRFSVLNPTSALLWRSLATASTTEQLAAEVCENFDVELPEALRDVEKVVEEMVALGLVVVAD
jgi:Coenzyme PQQ synthesis protein D (PqqD)